MANLKEGMQRWLKDHNIKGYYSCTQVLHRIEIYHQKTKTYPGRLPTLWEVPKRV